MKKRTIGVILPLLSILLAGQEAQIMQDSVQAVTKMTNKKPPTKPSGNLPNGQKLGNPPSGKAGKGGANTQSYDYRGKLKATLNVKTGHKKVGKKSFSNKKADQNAILVQKTGNLTLNGTKLTKTGSSKNDDNSNFYGLNSILLVNGKKAVAHVNHAQLLSNAIGANGIFATNKGKVYAQNTTIKTTGKANSRGLDATYGGTIIAKKMKISTKGDHSAAAATDRGGGNVSLSNSTVSTKGSGSPLVYTTGNIEYNHVKGKASASQIAGMEGYNRISLNKSSLISTNNKISGSDPIKNGVIIYQSMSGDADTSSDQSAVFQAKDSKLKTSISSGAMFYVTNTTGRIVLQNTKLSFASDKVNLVNVAGNDANNWGTKGENGGHLTFTGRNENLMGNIIVDSISSANVYLLNHTVYTGKTQVIANSNASSSSKFVAPITMNIDRHSKWIVTGNAEVTNLNLAAGGKIVDQEGKTVTIIANGKTIQKGTSNYTVTVKNKFSTSISTSNKNQISKNKIKTAA